MGKLLVLQRQSGEGCDFMIGCGYRYDLIDSDLGSDEFLSELKTRLAEGNDSFDPGGDREVMENLYFNLRRGSESQLKEFAVIPLDTNPIISHSDLLSDVSEIERSIREQRERETSILQDQENQSSSMEWEAKEREEYERLKRKFERE